MFCCCSASIIAIMITGDMNFDELIDDNIDDIKEMTNTTKKEKDDE